MLASLSEFEQISFDEFREQTKLSKAELKKSLDGHRKRSTEFLIAKVLIDTLPDDTSDEAYKAFELGRILGQTSMRWMEEHAAVRVNLQAAGRTGGRPKVDWKHRQSIAMKTLTYIKKSKPHLGETKAKKAAMKELNIKSLTTFNTWINGGPK